MKIRLKPSRLGAYVMATAPVGIAPVFTPQTFKQLAGWAEESRNETLARSIRQQIPFVSELVEQHFRPLTSIATDRNFEVRFELHALMFEPFRVHLNRIILDSLGGLNPLPFYTRVVSDLVLPMVAKADAMGFSSVLIKAILQDYIFVFTTLSEAALVPYQLSDFGRFQSSLEWMHSASRLDYGLTAIFLALEENLQFSRTKIRLALMVATKTAVLDLAETSSKFFGISHETLAPGRLLSARLDPDEIGNGQGSREHVMPSVNVPASPRAVELDWLRRNMKSLNEHCGKWIVIEKEELVASDRDYQKARVTASQRGIKRPFIFFVPSADDGELMGL